MKKIIFLIAILFGGLLLHAQEIENAAVPLNVRTNFAKIYPNVKYFSWGKEQASYEAYFKEDNLQETAVFDANGKFLQSEKIIPAAKLPKGAADYLEKSIPHKKIKEASQITDAAGVVTYEAEVKGVDYIFDANGNFLKKEAGEE